LMKAPKITAREIRVTLRIPESSKFKIQDGPLSPPPGTAGHLWFLNERLLLDFLAREHVARKPEFLGGFRHAVLVEGARILRKELVEQLAAFGLLRTVAVLHEGVGQVNDVQRGGRIALDCLVELLDRFGGRTAEDARELLEHAAERAVRAV